MAELTGSSTNIILKQATTLGTAVQGATGDRLEIESFTPSYSVTRGESNGIGSGLAINKDVDKLKTDVGFSITQQARYGDAGLPRALALFLGACTSAAEQNAGEGDYLHKGYFSPSALKLCTIARDGTSSSVMEYPSCYFNSFTIETGNTPNYLSWTGEGIANAEVITGTVNTNISLAAATVGSTRRISHSVTAGTIWLNEESDGALDSGDVINPQNVTITLNRPKLAIPCFGSTKVVYDDKLTGQVVITFPSFESMAYHTANIAGTKYKCRFGVEGAQIGAGDNESFYFYFPRLKIVENPANELADAGVNPLTVTFEILGADSTPTGMDYAVPYFTVTNENSGNLIS